MPYRTRFNHARRIILFFFFICIYDHITGQPFGKPGEHLPVELSGSGTLYGYYLYLPSSYQQSETPGYPLLLFFHGFEENGNGEGELSRVLRNGPPKRIQNGMELPSIVVSPQNEHGSWNIDQIDIFLTHLLQSYSIDRSRIYLTGLSKGGGALWEYLSKHPSRIAAAVPIAGSFDYKESTDLDQDGLDQLRSIPVWAFHSINDPVVPSQYSIDNVEFLAGTSGIVSELYPGTEEEPADTTITLIFDRSSENWQLNEGIASPNGNFPALTIYPVTGHDSWTETYDSNLIFDWLLSQQPAPLRVSAGLDSTYTPVPDSLVLRARILSYGGAPLRTSGWAQVGGPPVTVIQKDPLNAVAIHPAQGRYTFEFYAENENHEQDADTLHIKLSDQPTAVDPEQNPLLHLWPNPSDGTFRGRFEGRLPFEIRILSPDQKQLDHQICTERDFRIAIASFPPGVYLLVAESDGQRYTKRLIRK